MAELIPMNVELENINKKLNIIHNKLIFIYTPPKVGSTCLVSSLRIFNNGDYGIIHIHDEIMFEKLAGIKINITINDIINYNAQLGRQITVIDVYRSPIERKISTFFEKIGPIHFNASDEIVNEYDVNKVIKRFDDIFHHIANGDHFIDKYNIASNIPQVYPFAQKYLMIQRGNIKYIKLRLKDSNIWENILTNIFGFKICIVKDYLSENKKIGNLFKKFMEQYKIPENYLNDILRCRYLNYYFSPQEIQEYYSKWNLKKGANHQAFTLEQHNIYNIISSENCHLDYVQTTHYIDEGCYCNACIFKRKRLQKLIITKTYNGETVIHSEAKIEFLNQKITQVKKINNALAQKHSQTVSQSKQSKLRMHF
jgi:hypothetical protein